MEKKDLLQKTDYDKYANWQTVTLDKSVDQVRNIITGCPVWKETALPKTVWSVASEGTVLDFGCGLGRNANMLRRYFRRVIGYDLDAMLAMLNKQAPSLYDVTSSNLDELLRLPVTHIYEAVVWQHIIWSSGVTQLALDMITNQKTVKSIYTCWNSAVQHQSSMVAYLLHKGWKLEQSGDVDKDQLSTLANVPHRWYLFGRE
jgi:SAM-dependent methyltransferase